MLNKLILLIALTGIYFPVCAQKITSGPFVGAVTENSARIFVHLDQAGKGEIIFSEDSLQIENGSKLAFDAILENDFASIVDLIGLKSNTKYYYLAKTSADRSTIRSFTTFPVKNDKTPFTFTFGSCQSFKSLPPNEPVFAVMQKYKPKFFIQCGDWGYPDSTDRYPQDSNFFSNSYQRVVESYRARYIGGGQLMKLAETTPIDYIYDDHDYANDNASANTSSLYSTNFVEVPLAPQARRNIISAYSKFFPHYVLPDTTQGCYHSIRYGNIEIFVTDDRASRTPNFNSIEERNKVYYFNAPKGHTILGEKQMQWLTEGLKNSDAHWKFIISGVSFNLGYKKILDAISGNALVQNVSLPGIDASPKSILGATVDTWAGFPEDQQKLLSTLKENNITNVIFLSSDSHTSAMDDGTNAGIPEVMAGNLAQANSRLAWIMANVRSLPIIGNLITQDLSAWNSGGQGLGNDNYNNAFANIEVFGNDSVRCRLIDENDAHIATMLICDGGKPCPTSRQQKQDHKALMIYPNPAQDDITIQLNEASYLDPTSAIILADIAGRKLMQLPVKSTQENILLKDIPNGIYYIILSSKKGTLVKSFTKTNHK